MVARHRLVEILFMSLQASNARHAPPRHDLDLLARAQRAVSSPARGDDICPIPGVRSIAHLEDNLKALDIELTASETAWLDAAFPADIAAGPRYADAQMERVNR